MKQSASLLLVLLLAVPLAAQPENPLHSQHGPSLVGQTTVKLYAVRIFRAGRDYPFQQFRLDRPIPVSYLLDENPAALRSGRDYIVVTNLLSRHTRRFTYLELRKLVSRNPDATLDVR